MRWTLFPKLLLITFYLLPVITLSAEQNVFASQKYALVIGNGAYTGLSRLTNPVHDAVDVASVLEQLGFSVEQVLDASLEDMESAVFRLRDRLGTNNNSYGFFFYAGHGVQSGGENFLIPVDANIPSEAFLRNRSLSVQVVLDELNYAGNALNVVVLDACRDNPFGWSRAGNRGLAIITRQPADSIVVYATSAGQVASDGAGRNGLFTSQLLNNLGDPSLEVNEVFIRTGADVSAVSGRRQIPAIYNQFFGRAYLAGTPGQAGTERRPSGTLFVPQTGRETVTTENDRRELSKLWSVGASVGSSFSAPWFVGTVRGTIAPLSYSFLEIGLDVGMVSGTDDVGFRSIYPFAHYAFFLPVHKLVGWYIGVGGGYLWSELIYPSENVPLNFPNISFTTGFNIIDNIDISYTLRTNFSVVSNKFSVGYTFRFR